MTRFIRLTTGIFAFVVVHAQVPAQTQTVPKVIAIGDSITDDFGNGGWRWDLKAKLAIVGQAITYVGTRTDVAGAHEAYGGATSCDFFTDRSSFMASTYGKLATWDISTALAATAPSIAIIDIGTNNYIEDYYLRQGWASTVPCGLNPGSLQRLWDAVVYYPGITGVVITTVEDAAIPDGTENVNVIVRKYVADLRAQGKNVCLGELPANFTGLTINGDRYHLSALGNETVAASLVGPTLAAIAGSCAVSPPPTLSITVTPGIVVRGNNVTVTWNGIVNPSATDWIGLYQVGASNSSSSTWEWEYVSCSRAATTAKASGTCTLRTPVNAPTGDFNLRLFSNDGFNLLAISNTVVKLVGTIINDDPALSVSRFQAMPSGFDVDFNKAIDVSVLHLYDNESHQFDPPDVTLVGAAVGLVRGSLVVDASAGAITFAKTGGVLAPDTYTVTLRSAANAFKDTDGNLLDGNSDGVPGGDYVTSFVVDPSNSAIVSVPDFAVGPGQAVNVLFNQTGLPIVLTGGATVSNIKLTLLYNPALLTISAVTPGESLPSGTTVQANSASPGTLTLSVTSPTGFGASPIELARLTASVPDTAPYRSAQVLSFEITNLTPAALGAKADDAVHVVAYLGDTTGNGAYSSLDAQRVLRVAAGLDSGFTAYPLIDPVLIADTTWNGSIGALDATRMLQEAAGLDRPEIPPIPQK